jgi:hypothetical protein
VIVTVSIYSRGSQAFDPNVLSFFVIGPIVLAFDTLVYTLIVCPCLVNSCCFLRRSGVLVSVISRVIFSAIGLICFIIALYLSTVFLADGFGFVVEKLVMGLVVYPGVQKLAAFTLPYFRCQLGFTCCSVYVSIIGGWNTVRARMRAKSSLPTARSDTNLDSRKGNRQIELGEFLLLYS